MHSHQAETSGAQILTRGPGHRKALAVVADGQIGVIILEVDQDLDPGGPGMGLGIAQGFLGDSVEGDLRLRAGPFRITFDDEARSASE